MKVEGVIGKSKSIIKSIRQHTGAWNNVHELIPKDEERIKIFCWLGAKFSSIRIEIFLLFTLKILIPDYQYCSVYLGSW